MISHITTGNQGFSQQEFKTRPFFLSHHRDYEKEKERGFGRMQDGRQNLIAAAYTQPFSAMGGLSAAGYLGYQKYRHDNFTKHLSIDNVFSKVRELENRLPLFKIPLRGTQVGDLLSIFASDEALKTVYAGHELLDGKELKEQFQFLRKGYKGNLDEDLLKGNYRFSFQKKGRVFGDVVLENLTDPQNPTVAHRISDVFQMQRPSTKGGALTALYDPGKRPVSFFEKIDDNAFSMRLLKSLGASDSILKKWQYGGAVLKDSMYELFFEGVRGMNRFLKEPVPVLDRMMAWEKHDAFGLKKVSRVADSWKENGAIGKGFEQVFKSLWNVPIHEPVPWGRLPSFMRPYVREGAMTKTPLRLMAAISGKGALYVKGLPALYGGMDYFREQMSGFDPVTRAGVFGAIGMGVGSVIKSNAIAKGPLAGVLTRTQGWGMGLGMAVGALPVFNRGITAGIGGTYSSARIWSARFWDSVGGHDAVQRQEALFPGLTNPFTGVGMAMAGGFVGYFNAEIGTARSFNPFRKTPEGWQQLVQEGLTAFSQVDTNKAVHLPDDFMERLLNYHVNDQKGIIRGTAEASAVLQGKLKPSEVMTPTGLMAALIGEGRGKELFATTMPEEFFQRSATVEGAEVAATNIQRQLVTMHKAHAARKRLLRDSGKGFFGRAFGAASDAVSGPMGFTRGAIKGGLAFVGIAQVGALVAGIGGGNLSPAGLLPGWLIRATGGGSSAHETEAIFTGRQEVAIRKARWWSLGSSPWEGCLLPHTLVCVADAEAVKADQIQIGREVINLDGRFTEVVGVLTREAIEEPVVKIQTYYHQDAFLEVTGNHPILRSKDKQGKTLEWVAAIDIKQDDLLFIPKIQAPEDLLEITITNLLADVYFIEEGQWYSCQPKSTKYSDEAIDAVWEWGALPVKSKARKEQLECLIDKYDIDYKNAKWLLNDLRRGRLTKRRSIKGVRSNEIPLTQEFGRLLGYYAAEGCLIRNGICFTFHSDEVHYHQDVKNLIHQIFGVDVVIKKHKTAKSVTCEVYNKLVHDLFQHLVPGKAADGTKQLGHFLLRAPKPFLLGFVDGLIKGDGALKKGRYLQIELRPCPLLAQTQYIFNLLGIVSRLGLPRSSKLGHALQGVYVGSEGVARLSKFIDLKEISKVDPSQKNYNFFETPEGFLVKITHLSQYKYTGTVYDFEVKEGVSFLTPQCLVHNSKVQYHRAHRAVLMQSDAEDNAIYGSKEEKIAYDPILHPLKALFDDEFKYHRDMRLSEVSPSPLSSRMFADVPLLGDVMASTIGEFIKPTRAIRPMEWMQRDAKNLASMMGAQNVISPPGFGSFSDMGHTPPVAELGGDTQFKAIDPNKLDFVFGSTWKKATEQAGLRGFMANTFLENFGYKDRSYDPVIERGESLLGAGHKFWSLNLGDPGGTTELLRRYMTRDRNNYYNPLRNLQPSWMPGSDYFTDFQHGNVFRKVQEGAILLPGRGYETLNPELQGMHPENYSVGHRYKILSNVAYGSTEYVQAKQRALEAVQSGRASKRDMEIIAQTNKQSEAKRLKRAFRGYQFQDQGTTELDLTITGVTDDGRFTAAEMGATPLKLAGVNTTMAAFVREELARTNVGTIAEAERRAREKQAEAFAAMKGTLEVGKKIRVTVSSSGTERHGRKETEVYIKGLNEKIKGMGAEVDQDSNFSTSVQYNAMQRMFGSAWEQYTHKWADMPFTPAMVLNRIAPFQPDKKFIQRLTPTELYAQTRVYGPEIQMWQNYKQSFLDPFLHQTTAKIFGDFVPKQVQYNRAMVEYFDKLKWYKYHITEQAAIEAGRGEIAEIYAQKKRQTMFGADPYRGYLDIYRALPGTERDFYREFVNETNEKEREKILTLVPEYMKHLYIAQWQNQDIKALANRVEAGIASGEERKELRRLYNLRSVEGMNFNNELDQQYKNEARGSDLTYADWARTKELRQYFQTFKMPKGNFVGWDPRVDLEDVKLKLAKQEGVNIHDIGLWDSQDASISRKPYIGNAVADISDWMQGEEMHAGEFEGNMRRHIRQLTSRLDTVPLPPGMESRVVVSAHDTREHEVRREIRGRGII